MSIDRQFQKLISYLVNQQKLVGRSALENEDRPWQDFNELLDVDRFDFESIAQIFDREAANSRYEELHTNGNPAKDVQVLKHCADVLAGFERDYRMRTRTRVRMFVHAAGRSAAHGLAAGPLRRNTVDYVTRLLGEDKKEKEPAG